MSKYIYSKFKIDPISEHFDEWVYEFLCNTETLPDVSHFLDEIEEMTQGLKEWEKITRCIVYAYMYDSDAFPSVTHFLNTKINGNDGFKIAPLLTLHTIEDYYKYMKHEAQQDLENGYDATFAIDFIRIAEMETYQTIINSETLKGDEK